MASRSHRWPGEDTPLTGKHGGNKASALLAIAEASGRVAPKPRKMTAKWIERERAVQIARTQLDQLLSKLPPVTTPQRIDRTRPRASAARASERRSMLRHHIDAQDGRCAYCSCKMLPKLSEDRDRRATLDHVIPLSAGGPDTLANTVAACNACNGAKGSMSREDFMIRLNSEGAVP